MRTTRVLVTAAALAVASVAALTPAASPSRSDRYVMVGEQADGSVMTPIRQRLTPAGTSILFDGGRLQDTAISPDGRFAVGTAHRPWTQSLAVIDLQQGKVVQDFQLAGIGYGDVSYRGLLWAPDSRRVWVAQSGNLLRLDVAADGTLSAPKELWLPTSSTDWRVALPSDLVWAPDGRILATFNELNTLALVDAETGETSTQIRVGNAPRDVVLVGDRAYVANQGGREAQPGDFTNESALTPIVSDPESGAASTGTVSEVDLDAGEVVRTYQVGLQPSALTVRGTDLLVANSNDDTVSVIDTARKRVGVTVNVNPAPGRAYGASPNDVTFLPDGRLAVSLGRANAVAFYEYRGAYRTPRFLGLLPTAWYPATVEWDDTLDKLVITAMKGIGSRGPESTVYQGPGTEPATGHRTYDETGVVSLVDAPRARQLERGFWQVQRNNGWDRVDMRRGQGHAAPQPVPDRTGERSPIKHVFLIIKENRTYDQVLGDLPFGNGDPSLTQFGAETTPNWHALATEFNVFDNFYSGGTNSADGHIWLTQAIVNDYMERQFGNWYRSYPYAGADSLAYAKSGFIWENAQRHGVSVRSWGEMANWFESDTGEQPQGTWQDWWRDAQILAGTLDGELHKPVGYYKTRSDIPSMDRILDREFPNFQLQIPEQYRTELFLRDLRRYERRGGLPQLNLIYLPVDHTSAGAPGYPTQSAQVADNDLATGRIIEAISRSRFWRSSAVFVHEDDTQDGVDHVDGHRNLLTIASPYARRGALVSRYYTQIDLIATVERILGLPPMNQLDMAAVPMREAFTKRPDFRPYRARPNQIPLDTFPPPATQQSRVQLEWSRWAADQPFTDLPERLDTGKLNRATWYATEGWDTPYPGDAKVLLPGEVPDKPPVYPRELPGRD